MLHWYSNRLTIRDPWGSERRITLAIVRAVFWKEDLEAWEPGNEIREMITCWNLDVDGLCSSGGPSAPTLLTGSSDDLALPVATPTGGLHVEEPSVDHLLGDGGKQHERSYTEAKCHH